MPTIRWVFLLCFPNGGSTAFAHLILTANAAVSLTPRAEGQWLIPEMCVPRCRWDPSHPLDYGRIRDIWRSKAIEQSAGRDHITVIEKSPPNMVRYKAILNAVAPDPTYLVALTRDPYAVIASWAKKPPERISEEWGWPEAAPSTTTDFYEALTEIWLRRARLLAEALASCVHHTHYEDFGDSPYAAIAALAEKIPTLASVDPSSSLKIKEYPPSPPVNMNERQIASLSSKALDVISRRLESHRDVLDRLGYKIRQA